MGAENTPATPPAANGGTPIDMDALGRAIAASVSSAVAEAIKPIAEAVKAQAVTPPATPAPTATPPDKGGKAQPLTLEDVGRAVSEQLRTFQQQQSQTAERTRYQQDKLKDLPEVYRNLLGNDPAKWAAEEQQIRDRAKTDAAALGVKPAERTVGGDNPGGQKPGDGVDLSKLSPVQKVTLALQGSKPQGQRSGEATAAGPTGTTTGGAAGATTATTAATTTTAAAK